DELGVMLSERLVIKLQLRGYPFAEVLHEDVRLLHQLIDDLFRLRFFQVQGEAFLVAIVDFEIIVTLTRDAGPANTHNAPAGISPDAFFKLNDLSPKIAQH